MPFVLYMSDCEWVMMISFKCAKAKTTSKLCKSPQRKARVEWIPHESGLGQASVDARQTEDGDFVRKYCEMASRTKGAFLSLSSWRGDGVSVCGGAVASAVTATVTAVSARTRPIIAPSLAASASWARRRRGICI